MNLAAAPAKIRAVLIVPSRWWSSEHTLWQDAANFSLDAQARGCFCEILPDDGSAEHLRTVWAAPGNLRLQGALKPFRRHGRRACADFTIKPAPAGSDLTMTCTLGA